MLFSSLSELSDLIMLAPPPPEMNVFKLSIFIVLKETCKLYFFIVSDKTYKIVILACHKIQSLLAKMINHF